ncbi:hypothetical protein GPA21_11520 [Azoarcus taiwanensis]|uniref:Uncharacterized protein n=1 Tax=Azoarcus taiwanensis TaxID=666964 RepID=A0A972FBC8_9RHOO|nr:hypothetical protein [Azoarcus taiwanensis]
MVPSPFQVVGVELRGGGAESGWHVQSIEARAGVFRVDGQVQHLAAP